MLRGGNAGAGADPRAPHGRRQRGPPARRRGAGAGRIRAIVREGSSRGAAAVADEIVRLSRAFTASTGFEDDFTLVVLACRAATDGPPSAETAAMTTLLAPTDTFGLSGLPRHRCGRRHRLGSATARRRRSRRILSRSSRGTPRVNLRIVPAQSPVWNAGLEPPRPARDHPLPLRRRPAPHLAESGRMFSIYNQRPRDVPRHVPRGPRRRKRHPGRRSRRGAHDGTYIGGTVNLVALSAALRPRRRSSTVSSWPTTSPWRSPSVSWSPLPASPS